MAPDTHEFTATIDDSTQTPRELSIDLKARDADDLSGLPVRVTVDNRAGRTGTLRQIEPSAGGGDGGYVVEVDEPVRLTARAGDVTFSAATGFSVPEEVGDAMFEADGRNTLDEVRAEQRERTKASLLQMAENDPELRERIDDLGDDPEYDELVEAVAGESEA